MQELDLHGLTRVEAYCEMAETNNRLVESGQRGKLKIIHGYGSNGEGGTLREAVRRWLEALDADFVAGEFAGGNPGVTLLRLEKLFPMSPPRMKRKGGTLQ
jgi:DNA-nicking Smr family endonuclease